MKVLLVSLFHPEIVRGGAQQICYELFQGLRNVPGVEVNLLASIDGSHASLYKSGARITGFDGRPNEYLLLSQQYDYWWHKTTHSQLLESYAEFIEMLDPDVVHFHHFLTIGIDFLTLTRKVLPSSRIVFTFHEFLSICAADGQMLRRNDKSLCTRASSVRCSQCFPDISPEQFFIRELWMKSHLNCVDAFTTPSKFMIEHYTNWGLDGDKITHVVNGQPNYAKERAGLPKVRTVHNRFGFFGQMVDNKGIHIILKAVQYLRAEGFTDFRVEINGDNLKYASEARRREIEEFFEKEDALPFSERNVFLNGSYHTGELSARMARVDWCIVPSIWWEIFGLVISEAWMFGKPVIASNVGGPAERIKDEVDGLLFEVADPIALAETIKRACMEPGLWDKLNKGITPPPSREEMVSQFLEVYGIV